MFAVVKTYSSGKRYGKVISRFDCRYQAKKFIDNTDQNLVLVISNCKVGTEINNYKPDNYLYEWLTSERNPDPKQAVLLFKYS